MARDFYEYDFEKEYEDDKPEKKKEPLTDQSKSILFGLLGGFFTLAGLAMIILMFIL